MNTSLSINGYREAGILLLFSGCIFILSFTPKPTHLSDKKNIASLAFREIADTMFDMKDVITKSDFYKQDIFSNKHLMEHYRSTNFTSCSIKLLFMII